MSLDLDGDFRRATGIDAQQNAQQTAAAGDEQGLTSGTKAGPEGAENTGNVDEGLAVSTAANTPDWAVLDLNQ